MFLIDGDKITLIDAQGKLIASCARVPDGEPLLFQQSDFDYFPQSEEELVLKLNIVLCYFRVTLVICMLWFANSMPIVFLFSAVGSLFLDTISRYIICLSSFHLIAFLL